MEICVRISGEEISRVGLSFSLAPLSSGTWDGFAGVIEEEPVDKNERVGGHLGVVRLEKIFHGLVEIPVDGRLFNDDRLGRRSRMRLGRLKRRQKCARR